MEVLYAVKKHPILINHWLNWLGLAGLSSLCGKINCRKLLEFNERLQIIVESLFCNISTEIAKHLETFCDFNTNF